SNANLSNAALANLSNANLSNANLSNANLSNANLSNANLSNANLSNANLSNANLSNAAVSDLNYEFQNNGTTSTSYAIKLVGTPPRQGEALQLILAKTYTTPAAVGCVVKEEPPNHIPASIADVSGSVLDPNTAYVNPDVTVPSVTNATLSLAPGEKAQVTLRGRVTLARMAEIGAQLSPRLVPQGKPGGVTLYKDYFPRAGSTTTLQVGPATGHLQATVKDSATTAAVTVGTVTFVANGTLFIGTIRLDDPVNPPTTPGVAELVSDDVPTGATVVAYYSGSNAYLPSQGSSAVVTTSGWRQLAPMPTPRAAPAVAAPGSLIYALGGFDTNVGSTTPLALDTYSIRANSWTPQALQTWTMPPSGTVHAASVGGEMYFAYRASPLVLDVITRPTYMVVEKRNTGSGSVATSWSAYTTSFAMSSVAAVVPVGTNLYIFFEGRGSNTLGTSGPQMPVAIFDTLTGNFSLDTQGIPDPSGTAGVPSPVYLAAAADGDRIYIFGGAAFGTTVGSTAVWEYDTTRAAGSRFRAVEPMPSARWAHGAASLGGKIYVMGGTASQVRASTTTVDVFTPPSRTAEGATGTWTVGPAMTRPHSLPGVVVSPAENKFYVIGGLIEVNTSITMTNMNWTMLPINFVDEFTP
ncbi:MAG: pentapeptide repeat-containing protein, partial [Deltaproteobacteria bacterium]